MTSDIDSKLWLNKAISIIEADYNRSSDTHLIRLDLPRFPGIPLYLKDESSHPTGSLKHRLARSLFVYGLCNGWIGPTTCLVESSSGSTAVSEAYFAKLIGLRFISVVPASTAPKKIEAIRFMGGEIHTVDDPNMVVSEAKRLAILTGGHFLDQFTFAERATDWRGNNNIAESIFSQMSEEEHPVPSWIVCGAGTGGTSATIGRFIRYRKYDTKLCVADPQASVFHRYFADRTVDNGTHLTASLVEGIGRQRVVQSFLPEVIDRMVVVSDRDSIGGMRALSQFVGRKVGGSTGTNLVACLEIMSEMRSRSVNGSIVTLICDGGERYANTYYDDEWLDTKLSGWQDSERAMGMRMTGCSTR